jgi:SAM-dependent methyltransferase
VRVLAGHVANALPPNASVLEIGAGDGQLLAELARQRADCTYSGVDVLVRDVTYAPIERYDGRTLPRGDASVDVALFVDVLHHTDDPLSVLREARRVARRAIVIKDHTLQGLAAGATLRFMDKVGNARYGVALPFNYWPKERWDAAFDELGLSVELWNARLGLYPWPASLVFERSLHFLARLGLKQR